jgi:hypothetical protein
LLNDVDFRCFKKCIGSKFGSAKFERGEETCLQNCVDRFFDSHIFIVQRLPSPYWGPVLTSRLQIRGQH